MSWSRFDDLYDEHEKVEEAWFAFPPNPVGLHVMATTACNRWLSDGVVRPRWVTEKLPKARERTAVLAAMVNLGLFDLLVAGEVLERQDGAGNAIVAGPFPEDRYVVHDFLRRHDSSVQIKERREKDAARKRPGGAKDSGRTPRGIQAESARNPSASRAGVPSLPDQQDPPTPPRGGRARDRASHEERLRAWAASLFPGVDADSAYFAVKAATGEGARTRDEVLAGVRRWHPEVLEGVAA